MMLKKILKKKYAFFNAYAHEKDKAISKVLSLFYAMIKLSYNI